MAVDGTWKLTVNTPMGTQESTLVIAAAGATLTGTQSAGSDSKPIDAGRVNGNDISWKASINRPMPMTLEFSGTVNGDSLTGSVKLGMFGTQKFSAVSFDANGLVPAVAQDAGSGEVLMLAWMNREALRRTLATGDVVYWSRSRSQLWRKGETSGHTQRLVDALVDCDGDTLVLKVEQTGPACHTGAPTCFFRKAQR
jgi:phosphoribosyl-AMP cyclohydrolase